jgi:hypothetical protein
MKTMGWAWILAMLLGFSATAKPARPVTTPRLLSHAQFLRLSPSARAGYLHQVGRALVQFEAMQGRLHSGVRDVALKDSLRELIAQLRWLQEAQADTAAGLPFLKQSGSTWTFACSGGFVFDAVLQVCVSDAGGGQPLSVYDAGGCPSGTNFGMYRVEVRGGGAEPAGRCLATASWEALKPEVQTGLLSLDQFGLNRPDGKAFARVDRAPVYKSPAEAQAAVKAMGNFQPESRDAIAATPLPKAPIPQAVTHLAAGMPVTPVLRNGRWECSDNTNFTFRAEFGTCTSRIPDRCRSPGQGVTLVTANGTMYCVPSASFMALSKNQQEALCPTLNDQSFASEKGVQCMVGTPKVVGGTDDGAVHNVLGSLSGDQQKLLTGKLSAIPEEVSEQPAMPMSEVSPPAVPPPAEDVCRWRDIPRCAANPSADKAVRQAFRKAHDANFAAANQNFKSLCVFAGSFSSYKNNKASSGQCVPRTEIKGTGLKCAPRQVICNPVVFGVNADGKALCVNAKGQSTAECAEMVSDPQSFHAAGALSGEAWDKFKADFERAFQSYCAPSGSAAAGFAQQFQNYFCNECNAVGRTIAAANRDYAKSLSVCGGGGEVPAPVAPQSGSGGSPAEAQQ